MKTKCKISSYLKGVKVEVLEKDRGVYFCRMPDGVTMWIDSYYLEPIERFPCDDEQPNN
jgi:hypothetical protein